MENKNEINPKDKDQQTDAEKFTQVFPDHEGAQSNPVGERSTNQSGVEGDQDFAPANDVAKNEAKKEAAENTQQDPQLSSRDKGIKKDDCAENQ